MAIPASGTDRWKVFSSYSLSALCDAITTFINTGNNYVVDYTFSAAVTSAGTPVYSCWLHYDQVALATTRKFIYTLSGFDDEVNTWVTGTLYTPPGTLDRAFVIGITTLSGTGIKCHHVLAYQQYT